ncbi:TadE/TadG family type IV pilus assembly protein [Streptomyces sp. NPDC059740]|uniref:TadE/TadG family type IV pilus assembly protein n=1 Tax=Streptomyces sp. NPDC059740 TaxID=3346926 RepID=UPI0036577225
MATAAVIRARGTARTRGRGPATDGPGTGGSAHGRRQRRRTAAPGGSRDARARSAGRGTVTGAPDSGQVAVEFLGMLPLIAAVLVALWQLVLVGYAYSLAAHAADRGARAGAASEGGAAACQTAATRDIGAAYAPEPSCGPSGDLYRATVSIHVPLLFPGAGSLPWTVTGDAGAVREETRP